MTDRLLRYRIGAQDDASTVLRKVATESKRAMKSVQDDLDDSASKGKQLATVLGRMADDIEGDLDDLDRTMAVLGRSMPEEEARRFAEMLQRAGISAEDLGDDADELVGQMRRIEAAAERAGHSISDGMGAGETGVRRLADSSDQSRSVLANMVGNSAQDLGELGGIAGSTGVLVGQIGEYAADGNISLAGLAKMAGPMALLAVGVTAVTSTMSSLSERQKQFEEDTRSLTKSILDGADASSTLAERMVESGRVMATVTTENNFGEWLVSMGDEASHGTADITDALDRLGMKVYQFSDLASGGGEGIMEWRQAMADAGIEGADLELVNNALWASWDQVGQAAEGAAVMHRIGADAAEISARSLERTNEQLEIHRRRLDEAREAERLRVEGVLSAADAQLAWRDAQRALQEATEAAANTTDDATTAIDEHAEALDAAEQAALRQVDAHLAVADATYGVATSAEETRNRQVTALQAVIDSLAEDSPLRSRLQGYIDQLNAVPTSRTTTFYTQYSSLAPFNQAFASQAKAPSQIFGGPRATGGPIDAEHFYRVRDTNVPEIVEQGGESYLIPGANGRVTPLAPTASAGRDPELRRQTRLAEQQLDLLRDLLTAPPRTYVTQRS